MNKTENAVLNAAYEVETLLDTISKETLGRSTFSRIRPDFYYDPENNPGRIIEAGIGVRGHASWLTFHCYISKIANAGWEASWGLYEPYGAMQNEMEGKSYHSTKAATLNAIGAAYLKAINNKDMLASEAKQRGALRHF